MALDGEDDELARACVGESVLRLSQEQQIWIGGDDRDAFASALLADGSPPVRYRIAQYFASPGDESAASGGGVNLRAAAAAVIGAGPPEAAWRWLAEEI